MKNCLFLSCWLLVMSFIIGTRVFAADTTPSHRRVCSDIIKLGFVRCHARILTDEAGMPLTSITSKGFSPQQLQTAYGVSSLAHVTPPPIVGIVDAFDDPAIKNDLDTFSKAFQLPLLPECNGTIKKSSFPCFQKINERGQGIAYPAQRGPGTLSVPTKNAGWSLEIALDVQAVHAMCENCSILLVEADSSSLRHLLTAVEQAVTSGATIVSNSYGGQEFSSEKTYDHYFQHPGVLFTASAGDDGYGVSFPASSPNVLAVGGTSLFLTNNSYKTETAWSGTGSGCSAYEKKPAWQKDPGCKNRTVSDVSAVADPATGIAVYDSITYQGKKGWFTMGGTSLSAPIIAAIIAQSNNGLLSAVRGSTNAATNFYSSASLTKFHDILSGANGNCSVAYLCAAQKGFDGPTGLGSPKGW